MQELEKNNIALGSRNAEANSKVPSMSLDESAVNTSEENIRGSSNDLLNNYDSEPNDDTPTLALRSTSKNHMQTSSQTRHITQSDVTPNETFAYNNNNVNDHSRSSDLEIQNDVNPNADNNQIIPIIQIPNEQYSDESDFDPLYASVSARSSNPNSEPTLSSRLTAAPNQMISNDSHQLETTNANSNRVETINEDLNSSSAVTGQSNYLSHEHLQYREDFILNHAISPRTNSVASHHQSNEVNRITNESISPRLNLQHFSDNQVLNQSFSPSNDEVPNEKSSPNNYIRNESMSPRLNSALSNEQRSTDNRVLNQSMSPRINLVTPSHLSTHNNSTPMQFIPSGLNNFAPSPPVATSEHIANKPRYPERSAVISNQLLNSMQILPPRRSFVGSNQILQSDQSYSPSPKANNPIQRLDTSPETYETLTQNDPSESFDSDVNHHYDTPCSLYYDQDSNHVDDRARVSLQSKQFNGVTVSDVHSSSPITNEESRQFNSAVASYGQTCVPNSAVSQNPSEHVGADNRSNASFGADNRSNTSFDNGCFVNDAKLISYQDYPHAKIISLNNSHFVNNLPPIPVTAEDRNRVHEQYVDRLRESTMTENRLPNTHPRFDNYYDAVPREENDPTHHTNSTSFEYVSRMPKPNFRNIAESKTSNVSSNNPHNPVNKSIDEANIAGFMYDQHTINNHDFVRSNFAQYRNQNTAMVSQQQYLDISHTPVRKRVLQAPMDALNVRMQHFGWVQSIGDNQPL